MRIRLLPLVLVGVIGVALLAEATASASHARPAKATTLKYYFKADTTTFTNSKGKKVSSPGPGDHLYATVLLYAGTAKHHAATWTGSAFEYCSVTKVVSKTDIPGTCDYALSVGGSIVAGISTENLGASSNTYPITAGTGKWVHVKHGSVKTKATDGKGDANAVVTLG